MNAKIIQILAVLALVQPTAAFQTLESAYRTTGEAVVAVFEPQRAVLQKSSAVIRDGRREIGYGVVVSADGHLLAKASEIENAGKLNVTVDRKNFSEVEVLMVDPRWDVALVKVEPDEPLVPVEYAPTSEVPQGTWVVTNGVTTRTTRRALAGIVSARIREIPPEDGVALGIVLEDPEGLVIAEVNEKSGAKEAGLEPGDVILGVEGKPASKLEDLAEILKDRQVGAVVKLTIRRDGKELEFDVRLSARGETFEEDQMSRNDMMSGEFSRRRSGFPRVLQHDILGAARVVGGPLIDLDGRCLGMNIARANRTESYAIPVEDLKKLAEGMIAQSGK